MPDSTDIHAPTDDDLKSAKTLALDSSMLSAPPSSPFSGGNEPDPESGGQFGQGRYHVEDVIGAGGMGLVLKADDRSLGREVAIKQLQNPHQHDLKATLRFIHEAQVTGRMEHPNIIPIHELGVDSLGSVFYSMKMVKGVSLREIFDGLIKRDAETVTTYSFSRLLEIFLKVCDAMAFAHEKGVIHRDLKPDNIMVGEFGEVLVLDWGLAQRQDEDDDETPGKCPENIVLTVDSTEFTIQGGIKGTPGYMAPEQIRSREGGLDHRADIYALGAILYQILTLKKPVSGSALNEILVKTLKGDITPPVDLKVSKRFKSHLPGSRVPAALSAVAMKALERYSANRYGSIKYLQRDIESFQEGFATQAENAGFLRQLSLLAMRHKLELCTAVTLLVSVISVALYYRREWIIERDKAETSAQESELQTKEINKQLASIQESTTRIEATAPMFAAESLLRLKELRIEDALLYQTRAVRLQPANTDYRMQYGLLLLLLERFNDAELSYRALSKDGKDVSHYLLLVKSLTELKKRKTPDRFAFYAHLAKSNNCPEIAAWFRKFCNKGIEGVISALREKLKSNVITISTEDGLLDLLLRGHPTDLDPIKGLPFKRLSSNAQNLGSLHGMYIEELSLNSSEFINLDALSSLSVRKLEITSGKPFIMPHLRLNSLESLVVGNGKFTDISFLVKATKLKVLKLSWTETLGIEPLSDVKSLKTLELLSTPCRSIAPLKGLSLERFVSDFKISDLSPLKGMPLTDLFLYNCTNIRDVSPLKGMPLTDLFLYNCTNIRDVSPLKGMRLTGLSLTNCANIRDISPLKGMPLTDLSLTNCANIWDISPLKGMPLTRLDLDGCAKIRDISSLKGMPLTRLNLGGCLVESLNPLRDCPIETLQIINVPITDLTPLCELPLKKLYISERHLSLLPASFLKSTSLKKVTIDFNGTQKIMSIEEMSQRLKQ